MRSSHVAIQFPRFRFRVISIARPFAPFTPALDEEQASRVTSPSLPQVVRCERRRPFARRTRFCLYAVARLRPVRPLVPLLLIVHVDRHELVVVGLPLVNRLQVSSKG
jgi:hypothetical protein